MVELLAVLAIILTLSALSITAIQSTFQASRFDQNLSEIVETLGRARSYAIAENTYVWVAFYPVDPSQLSGGAQEMSGNQVLIATFASSAGTNPFTWGDTTAYTVPYTDATTGTSVYQLTKIQTFKQLQLWPEGGQGAGHFYNIYVPGASAPSQVATTPILSITSPHVGALPQTGSNTQSTTAVVVFSPRGSALDGPALSTSLALDFQPTRSASVSDSANTATIRIDGLTGLAAVYRQ